MEEELLRQIQAEHGLHYKSEWSFYGLMEYFKNCFLEFFESMIYGVGKTVPIVSVVIIVIVLLLALWAIFGFLRTKKSSIKRYKKEESKETPYNPELVLKLAISEERWQDALRPLLILTIKKLGGEPQLELTNSELVLSFPQLQPMANFLDRLCYSGQKVQKEDITRLMSMSESL